MNLTFTDRLIVFLSANEFILLFASLIFALVLFPLLEGNHPVKVQPKSLLRSRWVTNLILMVVNQFNFGWVTAFGAVGVAWLTDGRSFGFFPSLNIGFWTASLLAALTFEFISYSAHRVLHAVPFLWRIHAVHHCDPEIDFSTTFRNHPLELLVVAPFSVGIVLIIGFPPVAIVIYQLIRSVVLVFAHSNIKVPQGLDNFLRLFITTPDYHRVHHSINRFYTDSNFCPTFPVFDYLFGTAKRIPREELPETILGLDYPSEPRQMTIINLLLLPFIWKKPGRTVKTPSG